MNVSFKKQSTLNRPDTRLSLQSSDLQKIAQQCLNNNQQYLWKRIKHEMFIKIVNKFHRGCKDEDQVQDYFYAYMKQLVDWVQSEQSTNSNGRSIISAEDLAVLKKQLISAKAIAKYNSERVQRRNQKIIKMEKIMNSIYQKLSNHKMSKEHKIHSTDQCIIKNQSKIIEVLKRAINNFPTVCKQLLAQKQKQINRMFAQVINLIVNKFQKERQQKEFLQNVNVNLLKQIQAQIKQIKQLKLSTSKRQQQFEQSVANMFRRVNQKTSKDIKLYKKTIKASTVKQNKCQQQISQLMQKSRKLDNELKVLKNQQDHTQRQLIRTTQLLNLVQQRCKQQIIEAQTNIKLLKTKYDNQLSQKNNEIERLQILNASEIGKLNYNFRENEQNYKQIINSKILEIIKLQEQIKLSEANHTSQVNKFEQKLKEVEEKLITREEQIKMIQQLRKLKQQQIKGLNQKHEGVLNFKLNEDINYTHLINNIEKLCDDISLLKVENQYLSSKILKLTVKQAQSELYIEKEDDRQQQQSTIQHIDMLKHEQNQPYKSVNDSFLLEGTYRQFVICNTVDLHINEMKLRTSQETQTEIQQTNQQQSVDSSHSSYIYECERGVQCVCAMKDYCFQLDCLQLKSKLVQVTPQVTQTQSQTQYSSLNIAQTQTTNQENRQQIHSSIESLTEYVQQIQMLRKSQQISHNKLDQLREQYDKTKKQLGEVKHRLIAYLERDDSVQCTLQLTIKQLEANLQNVQQQNEYLKNHNEQLLQTIQYANSLFSVNNQIMPCSPKLVSRSLRKIGINSKTKNANCARNLQYDHTQSTYSQRGYQRSQNSSLRSFNLDYKSSDEIVQLPQYTCRNNEQQQRQNFDNSSIQGELPQQQTENSQHIDNHSDQSENSDFDGSQGNLVLSYSQAVARLLEKFVCEDQNQQGRIAAFKTLVQMLKPEPAVAEKFDKFIKRRKNKSFLSSTIKSPQTAGGKVELKQKLYRFLTES